MNKLVVVVKLLNQLTFTNTKSVSVKYILVRALFTLTARHIWELKNKHRSFLSIFWFSRKKERKHHLKIFSK